MSGNRYRFGVRMLLSKPWSERPWWSRWKDIISVGLTVVVLLIVVCDAVGRWLGH
jgi:hypothetical protein